LLLIQEDDEWKEFEEEKKDYTGLKIGNLQIEGEGVSGVGEEEEEQEMEENEAGELVPKRKVQSGPWKMVKQPQPTAAEASDVQGNLNYTSGRFMGKKKIGSHLSENLKGRDHFGNPGINGWIILNRM
jgi:hypothetical protein